MGGAEAVLERARAAHADGEYRWVAEVVNKVVFAEPDNEAARLLQADALEQLGYQAESGPWRNVYLSGAQELRRGVADLPAPNPNAPDIVLALTPEMLFDLLAVRLNGPDAADEDISLNLSFTDSGRDFSVRVARGVLNYRADSLAEEADISLVISRPDFIGLLSRTVTLRGLIGEDRVAVEGNPLTFATFAGLFDQFEFWFPIVTP
jgi:alkyl sulfatase BDS1-like metallo-beta-lactamase superfamily hydrolase